MQISEPDPFLDTNDESEHFFLRHLNKKLRNLNKKLREIEQLESLTQDLKPDQIKKISHKTKILEEKTQIDSIKILYYQAEKESQTPKITKKPSNLENIPSEILKEKDNDKSNLTTIKPIFELVYLSQLWLQCSYSENLPTLKKNDELMKDLSVLAEFYHKLFYLPQGVEFLSKEEKKLRYEEMEKYIIGIKEETAIKDKNYGDLNEIVKKYECLEEFSAKKEIKNCEEQKSLSSKEEITEKESNIEIKKEENIQSEEKKTLKSEKKRSFEPDSSKKYQLGEKKNNVKKGYFEKNSKKGIKKEEYVVEYVKKV